MNALFEENDVFVHTLHFGSCPEASCSIVPAALSFSLALKGESKGGLNF